MNKDAREVALREVPDPKAASPFPDFPLSPSRGGLPALSGSLASPAAAFTSGSAGGLAAVESWNGPERRASPLPPIFSGKHFVLVVDGDPHRARALAANLVARGCYSASSVTGEAALRYVAENEPDVVVADWELPDMRGLDLAGRLRGGGSAAGVVLLRSQADWRLLRATMERGGDDLLVRPFTVDQLLRAVGRCAPAARRGAGLKPLAARA